MTTTALLLTAVLVRLVASARVEDSEDVYSAEDSKVYNATPTTPKGCTCKSKCAAAALFNCYAADVCTVSDKECFRGTAESSVSQGFWDYCDYPADVPYEALKAAEKEALIMERVLADTESDAYPSIVTLMPGIMSESVRVTFESQSDIFPNPRKKYIHSVGAVGQITWESTGKHSYDGLFKSGAKHGLIRFSSANYPGYVATGFTPGFGLKLFRDGRQSANLFAMPSLDSQSCLSSSNNFFERDFTTHVPTIGNFARHPQNLGLTLIARKFWQASNCPLMIGLSDFADGSDKTPYMLKFKPAAHLKVECPCRDYAKCLADIGEALTPGDVIFEVHAQAAPKADFELIGRVRAGSQKPVTTKFGDTQLFFKHQAMENDFKIHPEWLEAIDKEKECGMKVVTTERPGPGIGCTSPIVQQRADDA